MKLLSLSRVVVPLAVLLGLWGRVWAHPGHDAAGGPPQTEVVAVVFSDFHSVACSEVHGLLDRLAEDRHLKLQRIFKHAPAHPDALMAHEAALAAGAQGKFQAMHDLLFKNTGAVGSALINMAMTLGLDLKRFEDALDERQFRPAVLKDIAEARGLGVRTTPTVFLNGTRLDGLEPLQSLVRRAAQPPPPAWESLPVENVDLDLDYSPASGPEDAPVTIVEFADFQCGFCRMHSQTLGQLTSAYPGLIRRVFKHYPLEVRDPALLPHLASMAALDQGRFWDLHLSLMTRTLDYSKPELQEHIRALGMNPVRFEVAIAGTRSRQLVLRDLAEGESLGIRATPTTFINGRRLVGRQPLEVLATYVDRILASRGIQAARVSPPAATTPPGGRVRETLPELTHSGGPVGTNDLCERQLLSESRPKSGAPAAPGNAKDAGPGAR